MRHFFACINKDFRLFFANVPGAILSLALPLLMFVLLSSGGEELMRASASVKPFAVAVRDEDDTFMSRTLTEQLNSVGLFETVFDARSLSDAALFDNRVAAVITIPKDFFYAAYDMDAEVAISLNPDMPLEASIVRELSVTVLEVVTANQTAAQVDALLDGSDASSDATKADAARAVFRDAFALLDAMQEETLPTGAWDPVAMMLLSCVLSLFVMLIPLQVAATTTDDLFSGMLPRYTAAGGRMMGVVLSKLCTALLLTVVPILAVLSVLYPDQCILLLPLVVAAFLAAFGLSLLLSATLARSERVLLIGNLYVLAALLLGGVIYPVSLMPRGIAPLRTVMLPHYVLDGVQRVLQTGTASAATLIPLLAVGAVSVVAGVLIFRRRWRRL